MICGPFGAAVLSDELRSFTSSASCCATVKTTNINVSGEDLLVKRKKMFSDHYHFARHVFSETPSEFVPIVLRGKPQKDMKLSPYASLS